MENFNCLFFKKFHGIKVFWVIRDYKHPSLKEPQHIIHFQLLYLFSSLQRLVFICLMQFIFWFLEGKECIKKSNEFIAFHTHQLGSVYVCICYVCMVTITMVSCAPIMVNCLEASRTSKASSCLVVQCEADVYWYFVWYFYKIILLKWPWHSWFQFDWCLACVRIIG